MFKKLVSNLPFNPSLITQLSFYGRRLKRETTIRRWGVIMIFLAFIVQSFAVFTPPEASVSANPDNDIIGSVYANGDVNATKQNILSAMQNGRVMAVYDHYRITKSVITDAATTITTIIPGDPQYRSAGWRPYGRGKEVEISAINGVVFYERDLASVAISPNSPMEVLTGKRMDGSWFAIILSCGNPVTTTPPPERKPVTGYFDDINCDRAAGWAFDPRLVNSSLSIHIYVNQVHVDTVLADRERTDVNKAGISGNHGWEWKIPDKYKDGKDYSVSAYAIENAAARGISENNSLLIGSPRSFRCAVINELPPDTTIQICRPGEGLKTIKSRGRLPSDRDIADCQKIEVCEGGQLKTIFKYEFNAQKHRLPDSSINCQTPVIKIVKSKLAANTTQRLKDANNTTAKPGDEIDYTLITANTGSTKSTRTAINESLSDVLEYADYVTSDQGSLDHSTNYVTWPSVDIAPDQEIRHFITVKVKLDIPSTPQGVTPGSSQSHDLVMTNVYGTAINIKVPGSVVKIIETTAKEMPNTGPGESLGLAFGITLVAGYFMARSRLLAKETEVIRDEFVSAGGRS